MGKSSAVSWVFNAYTTLEHLLDSVHIHFHFEFSKTDYCFVVLNWYVLLMGYSSKWGQNFKWGGSDSASYYTDF